MRSKRVTILGTHITLQTELSEEELEIAIDYVETLARQILSSTQETNKTVLFILVALNLASDLADSQRRLLHIDKECRILLQEIARALEEPGQNVSEDKGKGPYLEKLQ